jgi:alpha-tubulin suppressor-like RCC1 family protein
MLGETNRTGGGQVIVYNGGTGGFGSGGWGIIIAADNTYQGLLGGLTAFGTNVATANVWTHLALVCSGGTSTLYVNGVPAGGTSSGMYIPQGNFALGAPPQSPTSQFFSGLIDEVRVFTFAPGQFTTSDLLLKVWTPRLTVNGSNPLFLKHQTWGDPGVTVHGTPRGVSAGSFHSLVVKADGTVAAFGDNAYGQRNIASIANNAVAVAAGYYHSLALNADGTVLGRGYNLYGEINIPAGAVNVVAIAAGQYHSLALRADGTVIGWGDNSHGELNVPASATNVIAISAGDGHSMAVKANGTVLAWGYNGYHQTNVPPSATNAVAVAAGDFYSLALKRDGTVVGWGYNSDGEINIPASATNVLAIAAGETHGLALRADGTVIGWGNNFYGQASAPGNATNVVAIAGGRSHSLAVKADGTVLGWGYNGYGQISIPGGLDLANLPVTAIGTVNTNVPGNYQVNYFVTNSYGIVATTSRTVIVMDDPLITNPAASLLATNSVNGLRTVRFSAMVNPNGSPAIATFTYGLTAGYGLGSTNLLPGVFTPQTITLDVPLSPGFTYHWSVLATNGMDSIPGNAFLPDQVFTVPAAFLPGDANGDGIVDQSELDAVYGNYLPNSPWLLMTNVTGLGETNVTFALSNSIFGGYSVEVSTNLADWQLLGPATPRYLFSDTNAPAAPQRYYRLRYP